MSAVQPAAVRRGEYRSAGFAGIAFVILFVVGSIVTFDGQPDTGSAPQKIISYYGDSGHRDRINIGWLVILAAVFLFLWFLAGLRRALQRADADGTLSWMATAGGAVYAALTLVAFSLNAGIKTMSDDTFRHQVFPSLIHAADDASYVIYSSGGVGMAALIVGATLVAGRAGLIPRWAVVLGVIVGILSILLIFFLPNFLVLLWLLAASAGLIRSGGGTASVPEPGPAPAI
jgi:hypothetical protein